MVKYLALKRNLNLIIDGNGILRVGGRIGKADLLNDKKHPIIVLGNSHVAMLLVRHMMGVT